MKKVLLLSLCTLFLTGCSVDTSKEQISTLPTGQGFMFEEYDKSSGFKTIYEYKDGKKIISEFKEIVYIDHDKDIKSNLAEAITNNDITIENLIDIMSLTDIVNDGGSKIYKLSDNVWLVACNTLDNNKNFIIGTSNNIIDKCADQ